MQGYMVGHNANLPTIRQPCCKERWWIQYGPSDSWLNINNVRRTTMSRNNNRNYLEPPNLVSVYVSFVIPMINVWQLFTVRSKLSSNILFSHILDFVKLFFGQKNDHISKGTSQILVKIWDFSILVVSLLVLKFEKKLVVIICHDLSEFLRKCLLKSK